MSLLPCVFEPHNGFGGEFDGEAWPFGYLSVEGERAGFPNPLFELRPLSERPAEDLERYALTFAAAPEILSAGLAYLAALDELADTPVARLSSDDPRFTAVRDTRAALRAALTKATPQGGL